MSAGVTKSFLGIVAVMGLFLAGPASAVIITNSGVETVTKQFVIDGSVSTVMHNPGSDIGETPSAQSYVVSGGFDASISRYWWSYYLDGDTDGSQGSFIFEQNWLTFGNVKLLGIVDPRVFEFPSYFVHVDGANLFGDNDACTMPLGPNMFCSGAVDVSGRASLTGLYENGEISIQGYTPISGGRLFEEFTYDIRATAIPEPGILALLFSGLAGFLITKRRKW